MSCNGNVYDISRESHVYVSAKMQGHLERVKRVLGGKSKQWSSLVGSTLYLQKKQGDVMETIDLKEALLVRKVASGTHFEICMKKKTHLFLCPSTENCTAWVDALTAAMAPKVLSQQSSDLSQDTTSITDDRNIYNEVDEAFVSVSDDCNPQFSKTEPSTTAKLSHSTESYYGESGAGKIENDYWDIVDVRDNQCQAQANLKSLGNNSKGKTSIQNNTGQIYVDAVSDSAAKASYCEKSVEDTYAKVQKVKKPSTSQEASKTVPCISASRNEMASNDGVFMGENSSDTSIYSVVETNSDTDTTVNSIEAKAEAVSGLINSEDDSLFQRLTNALTDYSYPIQEYVHPLTEEDRKPLEELTLFLSKNREICRVSYSCVPISSDPVSNLKSYLQSLDISLLISGNN